MILLQSTGIVGVHQSAQFVWCWFCQGQNFVDARQALCKLNYSPSSVRHLYVTVIISVKAMMNVEIWTCSLLHSLCLNTSFLTFVLFWEATEPLASEAWLVAVNHWGLAFEHYRPSPVSSLGPLYPAHQNVDKLCKLLLLRTKTPPIGAWLDGSAVRSMCSFSRGAKFDFQHIYWVVHKCL